MFRIGHKFILLDKETKKQVSDCRMTRSNFSFYGEPAHTYQILLVLTVSENLGLLR